MIHPLGEPWEWIEPDQELEYSNWGIGKPDDNDGTKNCAHMKTEDGFWEDELCSGYSGYVCRALKSKSLLVSMTLMMVYMIEMI